MSFASVLDLAASAAANRFTLRDRMELDRLTGIAHDRGEERLVLHERLEGDPSDVGNYVAVYAAGCCWASWGLSRRLGGIVVWNSVTGLDSGRFTSMHEALSWVLGCRAGLPATRSPGEDAGHAPRLRMPARVPWTASGLVEGVGFEPT